MTPSGAGSDAHWRQRFDARRPDVLVVGTSDSARGRLIEAAARRAARTAGIPIVALEDFPGNYAGVAGGEADLLLVESEAAREICVARRGEPGPAVEVLSPARYDVYRERLREIREGTAAAWRADNAMRVLWAGQPETDDAVRTLEALLPEVRTQGAEVIFKAHPRDAGYVEGAYPPLFAASGLAYRDATAEPVAGALARAPRLIVTQFSSVAIEAGFYGIPSLCVLLPDAGGARLLEKKGYGVPPFCTAGACAFVTARGALGRSFASALRDAPFRERLRLAFDRYFEAGELQTPLLVERLAAFCAAQNRAN